jgi:hypothetical protein
MNILFSFKQKTCFYICEWQKFGSSYLQKCAGLVRIRIRNPDRRKIVAILRAWPEAILRIDQIKYDKRIRIRISGVN